MEEIKVRAPAKVNLALDIAGQREDGYHMMRMINHGVALSDELTLTACRDGLYLSCDDPRVPVDGANLVLKAAEALKEGAGIAAGCRIHIQKRIPMEAGLAGGSADAAAAIKGLNALWHLDMSSEAMGAFGAKLGADIPYCLAGGTALVEGIGEILTPLSSLPPWPLVVVKPPVAIATPWAFAQIDAQASVVHPPVADAAAALRAGDFKEAARLAGNTFEPVMTGLYPQIGEAIAQLEKAGAFRAVMSGSGSTVVGYFEDEDTARRAADSFASTQCQVFLTKII
jgi:4-diphosphocytidyl-2-C-methyl-D-erythritol kinase